MKNLALILLLLPIINLHAAWVVKKTINPNKGISSEIIQNITFVDREVLNPIVLREIPEYLVEGDESSETIYSEVLYPNNQLPSLLLKNFKPNKIEEKFEDSELRTIIKQGPDQNRIVITILGDGYTNQERQKFFDDVTRLVDDMFVGDTFKSYLALFNIYAVFVPSRDSGISDRLKKDTAFGLYRNPIGSKRAIMPGNTSAIERALDLAPHAADYPILIANDDYYGGLGGRYAITTRSIQSGTMVLRHELGHNFSNVGEEYDGGSVYQGANFSTDPDNKWAHWKEQKGEVYKNEMLLGEYVWQDLKNEFRAKFSFNKSGHQLGFKISSVGWETPEDVEVLVDNQRVELVGVYTDDRTFYRTKLVDLTPGEHTVIIRQKIADGNNVLAYANAYAYPADYDHTPDKIAAYSVFNSGRRFMGYRPTENLCLMREMRSKVFCAVDQENIWVEFFKRIKLIDDFKIDGNEKRAELVTPPLDHLDIRWYQKVQRAEQEMVELRGKKVWENSTLMKGNFRVTVEFLSPEIKLKNTTFKDSREFSF